MKSFKVQSWSTVPIIHPSASGRLVSHLPIRPCCVMHGPESFWKSRRWPPAQMGIRWDLKTGTPHAMVVRWCTRTGSARSSGPPFQGHVIQKVGKRRRRSQNPGTPAARRWIRLPSGGASSSRGATSASSSTLCRSSARRAPTEKPTPPGSGRSVLQKAKRRFARLQKAGAQGYDDPHFLQHKKVRPATKQVYEAAHDEFKAWAAENKVAIRLQAQRDQAMNRYVHMLYFRGEGIFAARTALYGTMFVDVLNPKDPLEFATARKALAGFAVASPDEQRDPCPWEAAVAIADFLAKRGLPGDIDAARATVLCFEGCLRPSETLGLRYGDVTVLRGTRSVLAYPEVSIRLAPFDSEDSTPTKSGEFDDTVILGDSASVSAKRGWVSDMLASLAKGMWKAKPIFSISLAQWERSFAEAALNLGLAPLKITPHCLRHGSASTDFAVGLRGLDAIKRRGRWKASASVRRYEKSGRLSRQVDLMPPEIVRSAKASAIHLAHVLMIRAPPRRSAQ